MPTVHVINMEASYVRMYEDRGWVVSDTVEDADFIQFCGGSDVTPSYYGHSKHPQTGNNERRDLREKEIYEKALRLGKNILGICRGGQFLHVMNGGTMIQHCDGHALYEGHELLDAVSRREVHVTSTHHQMMVVCPFSPGFVVAGCPDSRCSRKEYLRDRYIEDYIDEGLHPRDVEVVWYKDTKSLCFQPHPEFGPGECQDYFFELIGRYYGT